MVLFWKCHNNTICHKVKDSVRNVKWLWKQHLISSIYKIQVKIEWTKTKWTDAFYLPNRIIQASLKQNGKIKAMFQHFSVMFSSIPRFQRNCISICRTYLKCPSYSDVIVVYKWHTVQVSHNLFNFGFCLSFIVQNKKICKEILECLTSGQEGRILSGFISPLGGA